MTIFYYKNNDAKFLTINISHNKVDNVEDKNDFSILKDSNDNIVGINIFNLDGFDCNSAGFIYPTETVLKWIQHKTGITSLQPTSYIVVAQVIECDIIPNTHLHKCKVDDGKTIYDIICGAKNVKKGAKVVLSKVGAILPNGMQILPRKIGELTSYGMLCSEKELGLNQYSEGIIILPDSYKIGEPFWDIYKNVLK